ncbi:MAG TPA: hypothetical protein VKM56_15245 [Verrucomicrobiae bacterium]|nr:hypothetical protein [Verrucomicrobiae bacterium]
MRNAQHRGLTTDKEIGQDEFGFVFAWAVAGKGLPGAKGRVKSQIDALEFPQILV